MPKALIAEGLRFSAVAVTVKDVTEIKRETELVRIRHGYSQCTAHVKNQFGRWRHQGSPGLWQGTGSQGCLSQGGGFLHVSDLLSGLTDRPMRLCRKRYHLYPTSFYQAAPPTE